MSRAIRKDCLNEGIRGNTLVAPTEENKKKKCCLIRVQHVYRKQVGQIVQILTKPKSSP